MECWLYDIRGTYRDRFGPGDEGTLWLASVPSRGPVTTVALAGATERVDDRMMPGLARLVDEARGEQVALIVPRRAAVPRPDDRRVWSGIAGRVGPRSRLVDLLVVSERTSWSLRDELAMADDERWIEAEEAFDAGWDG